MEDSSPTVSSTEPPLTPGSVRRTVHRKRGEHFLISAGCPGPGWAREAGFTPDKEAIQPRTSKDDPQGAPSWLS